MIITSDLHFFHDREFIYKPRGFDSLQEMHEAYINEWNKRVMPEDDIYIVGDFCLGTDYDSIYELIHTLPGVKHLLIGNHDTDNKVKFYIENGIDVKYADMIVYKKRRFYLSHYPTMVSSPEGSLKNCIINLHGHIHTKQKFYCDMPYIYNVSVDANENKFLTLDEILENIQTKANECYQESLH